MIVHLNPYPYKFRGPGHEVNYDHIQLVTENETYTVYEDQESGELMITKTGGEGMLIVPKVANKVGII